MTTQMTNPTQAWTVRTAEDALALAWVMFGFEPRSSVVIECFGGMRPFQGRSDLPPAAALDQATTEAVVDQLVGPAQRLRVGGVVLLFYSDDHHATEKVWKAVRRRLARAGVDVVLALRADGGRYHPLRGDRRTREIGVPYDLADHPFVVRARAEGRTLLPDREALVATAAADPQEQAVTAAALAGGGFDDAALPGSAAARAEAAEWARGLVADHVGDGTTAGTEDLARLLRLLQCRPVAQAVWSLIDRSGAGGYADFFADVSRRCPDELVPAPAALLAWSAWQSGNGALAWVGVDRCREVEPEHALASLVAIALEGAWPPEALDGPRADWAPSLSD